MIFFFHIFKYFIYCKVMSSDTSRLEGRVGIYRLRMKGILDADLL